MKSKSSTLLILLLMLVVGFFAYKKLVVKKAPVNAGSELFENKDEQGNGLSRRPERGGGRQRADSGDAPHGGGRGSVESSAAPRGGGPSGAPKIDPEKKKKMMQEQSVF